MGVVVLGKETPGPQDRNRHPALARDEAAQILGRALGDPVDVARGDRSEVLVHPPRSALARPGAHVAPHHQRGGGGEHEARVPGLGGRFQQVERAGHVDVDESLPRKAGDVRLVERAAVDHRLDAVMRDRLEHEAPVGHRPDDRGRRARRHVEPDDFVPPRFQQRREVPAEPARGARQQHPHGIRPRFGSRR
jgi:hypothetical protein